MATLPPARTETSGLGASVGLVDLVRAQRREPSPPPAAPVTNRARQQPPDTSRLEVWYWLHPCGVGLNPVVPVE